MEKIYKPTIIISSLGRTGTKFFAQLFRELIPNCDAYHEPDMLTIYRRNFFSNTLKQINDAGVINLMIRRPLGRWSIVHLSDARLKRVINREQAIAKLIKYRKNFLRTKRSAIYVESSSGYYGLMDVLDDVYAHYRAIYLVRDPRHWVRSAYNRSKLYNKGKLFSTLSHTWPQADQFKDDPDKKNWTNLPRFVKLCWHWNNLNSFALKKIGHNPNIKIIKFEDIFFHGNKKEHINKALDFVCNINGLLIKHSKITDQQNNIINKSHQAGLSSWKTWTSDQAQILEKYCGRLMAALGYGKEDIWQDKLKK